MRIGIVQRDDTRDILASSGTLFFLSQALERHVGEVVHLGPDRSLTGKALLRAGQVGNRLSEALFKRRISPVHQKLLTLHAARLFGPRITRANCDILFAPFASVEIAALTTTLPIVYHGDMTWADAVDYYTIYSSLFAFARAQGERIQQAALDRAAASIFPSQWAAHTAIHHYGAEPDKVHVVPYGANFPAEALPTAEIAQSSHSLADEVRLLWIGVNWERKGGSLAFDCLTTLLDQGVPAHLTVCGCTPPPAYRHQQMTLVPFLNKNDPAQRRQLSQLFLEAGFFLFPTSTEALGIVLCEASAHGLPSLARDTGGVSTIVNNGVNGFLFPPQAEGRAYAEKIIHLRSQPGAYATLVRTSRETYEKRLNWDAWGRAVASIFQQVLAGRNIPGEHL